MRHLLWVAARVSPPIAPADDRRQHWGFVGDGNRSGQIHAPLLWKQSRRQRQKERRKHKTKEQKRGNDCDEKKSGAWGDDPNLEKKKSSENLEPIVPRVAPRVAPKIKVSHDLGRECNSENCFYTQGFRELLREWPFHSECFLFFSEDRGDSQVSE